MTNLKLADAFVLLGISFSIQMKQSRIVLVEHKWAYVHTEIEHKKKAIVLSFVRSFVCREEIKQKCPKLSSKSHLYNAIRMEKMAKLIILHVRTANIRYI